MDTSRKDLLLNIYAASKGAQISRKELERALMKARKEFADSKSNYLEYSSKLQGLQELSDQERTKMEEAKKYMMKCYETLRTMDLTGADAIRNRKDLQTYFVDGKEYHADQSDANDVKLVPWKEYKNMSKDEGCVDCGSVYDGFAGHEDDLDCNSTDDIAAAVDGFSTLCE